jgi:hypothetical protein
MLPLEALRIRLDAIRYSRIRLLGEVAEDVRLDAAGGDTRQSTPLKMPPATEGGVELKSFPVSQMSFSAP